MSPAFASTRSASAGSSRRLSRHPGQDLKYRRACSALRRARPCRGRARDHAAHRHHGLGQVNDARGDDRSHQRDHEQAHRHDRGPDRVRAQRQALGRSTSAKWAWTRSLRARLAPCAATGPGRDSRGGDARRGDRPHSAIRCRDRPPCALHRAHGGRPGVDQPPARLLSTPPAQPGTLDDRRHDSRRHLPAARPRHHRAVAWRSARSCA